MRDASFPFLVFSCLQGEDSPFMQSFYDKGRVSGLLKSVPIYAVLGEDLGLRGAHFVAYRVSTSSALFGGRFQVYLGGFSAPYVSDTFNMTTSYQ